MTPTPIPPISPTTQATQHGLLIAWGHFAQTLDLPARLTAVPLAQRTVKHTPAAKLLTCLLNILCGQEYLSDLSHHPAPLYRDPAVATAWGLPALAEASVVSRTLARADAATLHALQTTLDGVARPFLERALTDLRPLQQPIQLDADLTGRPVSDSSTSYPGAAFGYMDGQIRLGYQLAALCVQTTLYGRQWVVGQHHPGDTVSAPCLLALVAAAEQRLGCHPRRRTELLDQRIAERQATIAAWAARADYYATQHAVGQAVLEQVLAHLRACWSIADKLAREQGVYTRLTPAEAATIAALRAMQDEGWLAQEWQADELCRAAGLRPSDFGLLIGWLVAEDLRRDPAGVLIELKALFITGHQESSGGELNYEGPSAKFGFHRGCGKSRA